MFKKLLRSVLKALFGSKKPSPTPSPTPTPTPTPAGLPPKGQPVALDLLLRPGAGAKLLRNGQPFPWFQAIQCCGGADGTVLPLGTNTRWPLASEEWMNFSASKGANAFHFRLGPFYGDAENESEWSDLGGPLKADGSWNEPFWAKVRELTWHAAKLRANVEVVVIDTWYAKHAASSWGDQKMPWPQADIDAVGKVVTPVQEAFIRKAVSELGGFGNVIWATDNEGDQLQGWKPEWFARVQAIIRDEEQKSGGGVVHMVGTNNPDVGDGPFDFVATHERKALSAPIAGKWTVNNERNPSLGPDQEAAYFAQAREAGLGWSLWLADAQGEKVVRMFDLFEQVAKGGSSGGSGCFPPAEDDPAWVGLPVEPCPTFILDSLARAKQKVGPKGEGWPKDPEAAFQAMFGVLEELAACMRAEGLCAGRSRDQIFARADNGSRKWFELHPVAVATGGYTGTPFKGSVWQYNG